MLDSIIRKNCRALAPLSTGIAPRLNPLGPVKAVLFDVYGTLFVSGSGDVGAAAATPTAAALTQALEAAGFEGELERAGRAGAERLNTEMIDWHAAAEIDFPEVEILEIWKRILAALFHTEASPEQIRRLAVEYECRVNPVFPMPKSLETIERIKKRGQVLGLISNAQFYTPLLFRAFFGRSAEDCGFDPDGCIWSFKERRAKPSPLLFTKAGKFLREKHDIGLEESVYVGNDMLNDIYCARQAGCRTVLFAGDQRSLRLRENDERCLAIQPDAVITSLDQLMEII